MLLTNCLRRINKINITKCLNKPLSTKCCVAGVSNTTYPVKLVNSSVSNVSSTALFTRYNEHLSHSHRYYSSNGGDKKATNDTDDDDLTNWHRQLPRFGDYFEVTPSLYLMLKNALSTLLIRSYFDQNFNKNEFLAGARRAVEVVSNLLANANFDDLQDMVDEETINKMRYVVGSMTPEQRKLLIVNDSDIQWIFPHEIQFITKEIVAENKSRFFVEIMVVIHAYRDNDVELSDFFLKSPNLNLTSEGELLAKLEKHYSVANYRFIKEFTKGVEDDWTINHIFHVKPTDELKEKRKLLKESS